MKNHKKIRRKYIISRSGLCLGYIQEKTVVHLTKLILWVIVAIGIVVGLTYTAMVNVNLPELSNISFGVGLPQ